LIDPSKTPGLDNILGPIGQMKKQGATFGNTTQALTLYNNIMAKQYAAGVQDFKGAGRITQNELATDAPGQSLMNNRNQTPDQFRANTQAYINKLQLKRANAAGAAGQLSGLSDEDYALANSIYKPGGALAASGPQPARGGGGKALSPSDIQTAKAMLALGDNSDITAMKKAGYDISPLMN
jgi:hypothetical protein